MVAESIQFAKLSIEMGCCIGDGIQPPIKRTHLNHPTRAPEIHRTQYFLYTKKAEVHDTGTAAAPAAGTDLDHEDGGASRDDDERKVPIYAKRSKPVTEAEIGMAES